MKIFAFYNKFIQNVNFEDIPNILSKKGKIWIDIQKPTKKQMIELQKIFGFHELTIEDCLGPSVLPKINEYDDYVFIAINRIDISHGTIRLGDIYFYLSSNYLVSIHSEQSRSVNEINEKLVRNPEILKKGPDFLMYGIMDRITDRYAEVLDEIDKKIEILEVKVLKSKIDNSMQEIVNIRRILSSFKRSLTPQKDLMFKLARRDTKFVQISNLIYFRDVADQVVRAISTVDNLREIVTGLFEAYLSIHSNKLNQIIKALTVVATIFLPLTFLTGVYGMNFRNFPELEWEYGYFGFWGVSIFISLVMIVYFRIKKYI